jgi:hypothetical protein
MARKTVTIRMPDEEAPRSFHLHEEKAERFAAKVRAEGGIATIGPLTLGEDLSGMLIRAGVDPDQVC